jgi:hypothetical protein
VTTSRADGVNHTQLGFGRTAGLGFEFDRVKLAGVQHHHIGQAGDRAQALVDRGFLRPPKATGERVPEQRTRHGAGAQMRKDGF